MSTAIEWTDETWNPVAGCNPVSPGCAHCYAAVMARRLAAMADADLSRSREPGRKAAYLGTVNQAGKWTGVVNTIPDALGDPIKWKRPRRIFVNSMSDLFHEQIPFDFIDRVFAVMNATALTLPIRQTSDRWHTYQVLTKQPERMRDYMESRRASRFGQGMHPLFAAGRGESGVLRGHGVEVMNAGAVLQWPPPNVWLGVSVENQEWADKRREAFEATPAAVKFVSYEPALGPVDWTGWEFVDQVISGGESGPHARPSTPESHIETRDFCQSAGIAYFFKQWGEWCPFSHLPQSTLDTVDLDRLPTRSVGEHSYHRVGKKAAGRELHGRTWDEFPSAESAHV